MDLGLPLRHVYKVKILPKPTVCLSPLVQGRAFRSFHTLQPRMTHSNASSNLATNGYTEQQDPKLAVAASTGDLNNVAAMRATTLPQRDPLFAYLSLAIMPDEDEPAVRTLYRPFLLSDKIQHTDWVSKLELAIVTKMADEDFRKTCSRLKVLVLYGSLRKRLAYSPLQNHRLILSLGLTLSFLLTKSLAYYFD